MPNMTERIYAIVPTAGMREREHARGRRRTLHEIIIDEL